jgi:hypothetical protein
MTSRYVHVPRILFSLGLAQFTALSSGLIIYGPDIAAVTDAKFREANRALIATASAQADAQIQREGNAIATQTTRVSSLTQQVTRLTQNSLDPVLNDPAVQQLQAEIASLTEQRTKAHEAIRSAELFAANESGGIKGAPGNTGKPGQGARYKAAIQQAEEAKTRAQELERKISVAQSRLTEARERAAASSDTTMQRSRDQLPSLEVSLKSEKVELERIKARLAKLLASREVTVRKAVEAAPDYVKPESGFLHQLTVLGNLAAENRQTAAVILLIDFLAFALEAAALLSKILVRLPSSYGCRVARDAQRRTLAVAFEHDPPDDGSDPPTGPPPPPPAPVDPTRPSPSGSAAVPIKRPRGRPRKEQLVPAA